MNDQNTTKQAGASTEPQRSIPRQDIPIVSEVDEVPAFEALMPKERRKVRIGEPYHFAIDVICESTSGFGKRAIVTSPVPGGISFEILSDEGKSIGGKDAAPAPLAYFTAGVAFCLLTHITGYLRLSSLDVRKIKLEVRGNYMTMLGHIDRGGQGEGGCDSFETYVVIDSDEPPEKVQEFIAICEKACIASQTIAKSVPTSVNVILNGRGVRT